MCSGSVFYYLLYKLGLTGSSGTAVGTKVPVAVSIGDTPDIPVVAVSVLLWLSIFLDDPITVVVPSSTSILYFSNTKSAIIVFDYSTALSS